jgi:hypothetical protein
MFPAIPEVATITQNPSEYSPLYGEISVSMNGAFVFDDCLNAAKWKLQPWMESLPDFESEKDRNSNLKRKSNQKPQLAFQIGKLALVYSFVALFDVVIPGGVEIFGPHCFGSCNCPLRDRHASHEWRLSWWLIQFNQPPLFRSRHVCWSRS